MSSASDERPQNHGSEHGPATVGCRDARAVLLAWLNSIVPLSWVTRSRNTRSRRPGPPNSNSPIFNHTWNRRGQLHRLPCPMFFSSEAGGNVTGDAHAQVLGNPLRRHCGLGAQTRGNFELFRAGLPEVLQSLNVPPAALQRKFLLPLFVSN